MAETIFSEENNTQATENKPQNQGEKKHKFLKPLLVILAVILLVGATGFGVWYWQQQESQKQKADSDKQVSELQKQVSEKTKTDTKTEEKSGWKTYINNQDGFLLTFPENWKGYGTTDSLEDDKVTKHIYFGLPLKTSNTLYSFGFERNYNNFFAISIVDKVKWEAEKDSPGGGDKIAEKGDKVYTYSHANGVQGELNTGSVEAVNKEITAIIASFKLLP